MVARVSKLVVVVMRRRSNMGLTLGGCARAINGDCIALWRLFGGSEGISTCVATVGLTVREAGVGLICLCASLCGIGEDGLEMYSFSDLPVELEATLEFSARACVVELLINVGDSGGAVLVTVLMSIVFDVAPNSGGILDDRKTFS